MSDPPPLPPWPREAPTHGSVVLREFTDADVPFAVALARDPYVPLIGSLPDHADEEQALAWIERQRGRLAEGRGYSFAIAEASSGRAVGAIGLWLASLAAGRATVGYSVAPDERGRGYAADAVKAVTTFAWTLPGLHRVELFIEPWNTGSVRVAESAGFEREGLLRSHQQIGDTRRDMLLYAVIRRE